MQTEKIYFSLFIMKMLYICYLFCGWVGRRVFLIFCLCSLLQHSW